jgi:hypothetical protein
MQAAEHSGDSGHRLLKMSNWIALMTFFFICKLSTTGAQIGENLESCKAALNESQALAEDAQQKLHIMMAIAAILVVMLCVATLLYLYKKPTIPAAAVGGDDLTAKLEALTKEHTRLKEEYKKHTTPAAAVGGDDLTAKLKTLTEEYNRLKEDYKFLAITTDLYKSATSTLHVSMPECMVTTILYFISEDLGRKFYGLKYTIKCLFPIDRIAQFLACGIIVFVIMVPIYTCMGIYQAQSLSWNMLQSAITSSFELIMWLPMTVWNWFMSATTVWDSFMHPERAAANGWWWGGSSK